MRAKITFECEDESLLNIIRTHVISSINCKLECYENLNKSQFEKEINYIGLQLENLKYPTLKIASKSCSNEQCSICLNTYTIPEKIRTLNCGHSFHKRCIDKWLNQNQSCPICRQNIFVIN